MIFHCRFHSHVGRSLVVMVNFSKLFYRSGKYCYCSFIVIFFYYQSAAENIMLHIFSLQRNAGLAPIYINADSGEFRPGSHITFGARGDSYYEYLLKQWIQTGKTDEV